MSSKKLALITRSDLLEEIESVYRDHYEQSYYKAIHDFFNAVCRRIRRAPVVEVVHAKWIKHWHDTGMIGHEYEECSNCGCMISDTEKFWDCNYCPRCGAKMDGKNNVLRED